MSVAEWDCDTAGSVSAQSAVSASSRTVISFLTHTPVIRPCVLVGYLTGVLGTAMGDLPGDAILPLLLGLGCAFLVGVAFAYPRLRRSPLPAVVALATPVLLAVVWCYQLPTPVSERRPEPVNRGEPQADLMFRLMDKVVTDCGRPVKLGTLRRSAPLTELAEYETEWIRKYELSKKVIVRGDPDPTYNCHGWVFTGGQYWVYEVDAILADNGYTSVATPSVDDLAIYRGPAGDITHSGLVRVTTGGTLVESKWGPMGRYLHTAENHPYSGVCTFYRSTRRGHMLSGLPTNPGRARNE